LDLPDRPFRGSEAIVAGTVTRRQLGGAGVRTTFSARRSAWSPWCGRSSTT